MFHVIRILLEALLALASGLFWLALTAFMIWMILDCATKEPRRGHERLVWVIITVFVPYFGAVAYYLLRRPQRIRAYGI